MEELITLIYKSYGLVGILVIAPIVDCIYIWRENKSLHYSTARQIALSHERVASALQERVMDAQSITNKLVEIVAEQAAVNRETSLILDRLETKLSVLRVRS